jgi:hypothetical protein
MFELARIRLRGWAKTMVGVAGLVMFVVAALGFWTRRSAAFIALPESIRDNPIYRNELALFAMLMIGLAVAIWFAWGSTSARARAYD